MMRRRVAGPMRERRGGGEPSTAMARINRFVISVPFSSAVPIVTAGEAWTRRGERQLSTKQGDQLLSRRTEIGQKPGLALDRTGVEE